MKSPYSDWSNVKQQREIEAIAQLCHDCQHLVAIYDIIREKDSKLYFVGELMSDGDLKDFLARYRRKEELVDPALIRSILQQVLCGLKHIHSRGYMHRDLKPENLLMSRGKCKVADFSLARPATIGESGRLMTTYVSSRWYRAPEIVLEATMYTTAIDVFALGCVMAELFSLEPLFPGKDEHDQLPVMLSLLGPMTEREWPEGIRLIERLQLKIPPKAQPRDVTIPVPHRLADKLHVSDTSTITLLDGMLKLNPNDRPSVDMALDHAYFLSPPPNAPALPAHATTPEQSPTFSAFGRILSDESANKRTPKMTTSSVQHNRAPFVSISPTARLTPAFDYASHGFAKVQVGNASQMLGGTVDNNRRDVSPRVPSTTENSSNSLRSILKLIHSDYRPADAFDID
jgi:serine/threonine protein kinase